VVSIFSENKFDSIMPEDYVVVELEYDNSTEQCQPDIGIEKAYRESVNKFQSESGDQLVIDCYCR
jgi:hypothetical protein